MSTIQKLAIAYALMFGFVAIMGYIPPFVDEQGLLFGLFSLDLHDNLLHAFSGVWALTAAWLSHRQAVFYFKMFGTVYFLDGVMGIVLGNAFLDFGIFHNGIASYDLLTKFFMNIPHIAIGGIAMYIGFKLATRYGQSIQKNP
jgi:hypothetical protein